MYLIIISLIDIIINIFLILHEKIMLWVLQMTTLNLLRNKKNIKLDILLI